jgi:hypothetical protein
VTLILRRRHRLLCDYSVMLCRKPPSGDSGRSIYGMFSPLEAHAYRVCDKTSDARFGRRRAGAGSTVTFSSIAAGAFGHGRQPGTLRPVDARAEP